jgi:hypothetical protein
MFLVILAACKENTTYDTGIDVNLHFKKIGELPAEILESSGMIEWQGSYWTLNDSGDGPFLYQINPEEDALQKQLEVEGAENQDWESLNRDSQFVYIGDFGNNSGMRKNLRIFKMPIEQLNGASDSLPELEQIDFVYEDQTRFDFDFAAHDYDCEAMISYQGKLYLFSKNHDNKQCRSYLLSSEAGRDTARVLERFNTDGTITGAALNTEGKTLALLGYNYSDWKGFRPFVWLFSEFEGDRFFSGKSQRIDIPVKVQTEAIAFINSGTLLISSEAEDGDRGQLYQFDISEWLK